MAAHAERAHQLIDAILSLQETTKAKNVCNHGGWLENDRWGGHTGYALYSTAINVLTLEVYYRYENAFGVGAKGAGDVIEAVQKPK